MTTMPIEVSVEQDAAHILLLWLLIHGGDPGPDDDGPIVVSAEALAQARQLASTLAAEFAESHLADSEALGARLSEKLGVLPVRAGTGPVLIDARPICVSHDGVTICVTQRL